jgi:hypothetical protein
MTTKILRNHTKKKYRWKAKIASKNTWVTFKSHKKSSISKYKSKKKKPFNQIT